MLTIRKETGVCVQSGDVFAYCILSANGLRFFATEDEEYLVNSLLLFTEDNVTLVLAWDRNSAEAPELGPKMDVEIASDLYIRRSGQKMQFITKSPSVPETVVFSCDIGEWTRAVTEFSKTRKSEPWQ